MNVTANTQMRITARILVTTALAVILAVLALARPATAETDFPNRPIHVVLPYPAGGIVDIVTRIVTEKVQDVLKQPVVVENKPGASGNLAWAQAARAAPDGYTWTFVSPALFANPRMQSNVPFSDKDFVPVGGTVYTPWMFVSSPSVPVKTLKEFVDYVHAHPRELNWANGGTGTTPHFNAALLFNATKIELVEVPYKGQPPAILDLLANRVQFMPASPNLVLQYIQDGKMTPLGVVGKTRLPQLPDVPTMAEAGYPETNVASWYGYCVPKGTPQEIVDKIVAAFGVAVKDATVRSQLEKQITQVMEPKTAAELQAMYAADAEKYAKIIQDANIHIQE
jgi:tripartite-type tricarboxylate transporter receptor subunit TctC